MQKCWIWELSAQSLKYDMPSPIGFEMGIFSPVSFHEKNYSEAWCHTCPILKIFNSKQDFCLSDWNHSSFIFLLLLFFWK